MYNYHQALENDIESYLEDNDIELSEDNFEEVYDKLWVDDSITGNASGSYTFNTYQAEENIAHNWDLLLEALDAFGYNNINILEKGAEWCDVTIRCYLLHQILLEFV
jgi:hypothetical protein